QYQHNLMAYLTKENFMSYISNNDSIFIKNICNEINKNEDDDISSILRKVNNEIAKETKNKQLSEFQDRFLANFYFQPKNEKNSYSKTYSDFLINPNPLYCGLISKDTQKFE
ncbi:unnamed protein product, partial [Brachionus calyciflorus]